MNSKLYLHVDLRSGFLFLKVIFNLGASEIEFGKAFIGFHPDGMVAVLSVPYMYMT